jgi:hypothetical protein
MRFDRWWRYGFPRRGGAFGADAFGSSGNRRQGEIFGEGEPIRWGERDSPDIARHLQLYSNLEKLANRPGPLDPGHPRPNHAWVATRLVVRHLDRDPHVLQNVVLGLIPAAMGVNDQRGRSLLEGSPERIDAGYRKWNGLNDARAAALL